MTKGWVRQAVLIGAGVAALMGAAIPLFRTGPLSGRTIVVDPGHGGPRDLGAVARNGLRESDLNLQVALRLDDLLRRQGARVILTRTRDSEVAPHQGDAGDLKARAAIANEQKADLFLSIHHNDTIQANDPRHDTQVYWKLDDEGPSRDFAQLLLPTLATALRQPKQRLIAGNFAVLRHCERPAILGEGAYLSNPRSAAYLITPEAQQAEAAAYADSIRRYFERGVPVLGPPRPMPDGGVTIPVGGDAAGIVQATLTVDGTPVNARYRSDDQDLVWSPTTPLANGRHEYRAMVRNAAGNASLPKETTFAVDRPAAAVTLAATPEVWDPGLTSHVLLSATVTDGVGLPVADGTPVAFTIGRRAVTGRTRAGRASAFVPWTGDLPAPAAASTGRVRVEQLFAPAARSPQLVVRVLADGSDVPAATVQVDGKTVGQVDGDGRLGVAVSAGPHRLTVRAPGYRPWQTTLTATLNQVPTVTVPLAVQYGGTLLGKTVLLDPLAAGTGTDLDRRTLGVATRLQQKLAAAGVHAVVTRHAGPEGQAAQPADRVRLAERAGADLYVVIGVGDGTAAHYYASRNGARLAGLVHQQLAGIAPKADASYLLSHTPCPALVVRSPLQAPDLLADALFEAMRRYYAPLPPK
jgi:N-acetylmuramoyl-L-alanine amidase